QRQPYREPVVAAECRLRSRQRLSVAEVDAVAAPLFVLACSAAPQPGQPAAAPLETGRGTRQESGDLWQSLCCMSPIERGGAGMSAPMAAWAPGRVGLSAVARSVQRRGAQEPACPCT